MKCELLEGKYDLRATVSLSLKGLWTCFEPICRCGQVQERDCISFLSLELKMQKFKDEKATHAATQPRDVQTSCLLRGKSQLCCDELLAYLALVSARDAVVERLAFACVKRPSGKALHHTKSGTAKWQCPLLHHPPLSECWAPGQLISVPTSC